ncbi:DUF547 domain-containing protein [Pontibacter cellulosilyticus]|uniref:DUF547 domain-containing protein n=1 Tax=Pontibacter cellulosilyticus TaxID=1720253 RepID=UPI001E4ECCD3|nr:DUF547 domain-containing protein [Pontibacter cellulosilyticus]
MPAGATTSAKPDHQLWTNLLQKHVNSAGFVDYGNFLKDNVELDSYLQALSAGIPDSQNWTREEQLAYWINAYNAFTVKLILENYPLKSIKDLNSPISVPFLNSIWDKKFINLGGKKYSLNNIEHNILREKFQEPRIHFAINCASVSCPKLRNEAYIASKLNQQLEDQAETFINDPSKNKLLPSNPKLSKIFSWFGADFEKQGNLRNYVNRYADIKVKADANIDYMEYDWNLNDQ